jgi:hypothetical protein
MPPLFSAVEGRATRGGGLAQFTGTKVELAKTFGNFGVGAIESHIGKQSVKKREILQWSSLPFEIFSPGRLAVICESSARAIKRGINRDTH